MLLGIPVSLMLPLFAQQRNYFIPQCTQTLDVFHPCYGTNLIHSIYLANSKPLNYKILCQILNIYTPVCYPYSNSNFIQTVIPFEINYLKEKNAI